MNEQVMNKCGRIMVAVAFSAIVLGGVEGQTPAPATPSSDPSNAHPTPTPPSTPAPVKDSRAPKGAEEKTIASLSGNQFVLPGTYQLTLQEVRAGDDRASTAKDPSPSKKAIGTTKKKDGEVCCKMDPLTFVAELIKALAWPAAVLAGLYLFRSKIANLLDRVSLFEGGGVKITLSDKIREAEEEAEAEFPELSASEARATVTEKAVEIVRSPTEIVLDAWQKLENAIIHAHARNQSKSPKQRKSIVDLAHDLEISPRAKQLINTLRNLRNDVVHLRVKISSGDAYEYAEAAGRVINSLKMVST